MKLRSGKSAALASGAALTVLLACSALAFHEPLLEQYWLWKLGSPDQTEREAAAEQLGRMGSVRALTRVLPLWEADLLTTLNHFEWYCHGGRLPQAYRIGGMLYDPERLDRYKYEPLSRYLSGLRTVGSSERRILRLSRLLSDPRDAMRTSVAYLLGQLGHTAGPAVPELTELLNDEFRYARIHAVKSLGKTGPASKPAAPALIALLGSRDYVFRDFSAEALGLIGPPAEAAVPALRALLSSDDEALRTIAGTALQRIGGR